MMLHEAERRVISRAFFERPYFIVAAYRSIAGFMGRWIEMQRSGLIPK